VVRNKFDQVSWSPFEAIGGCGMMAAWSAWSGLPCGGLSDVLLLGHLDASTGDPQPVSEGASGVPIWELLSQYLRAKLSLAAPKLNLPRLAGAEGNPGLA
jgi:hypothetical protein